MSDDIDEEKALINANYPNCVLVAYATEGIISDPDSPDVLKEAMEFETFEQSLAYVKGLVTLHINTRPE
jgi:hypothetical protein